MSVVDRNSVKPLFGAVRRCVDAPSPPGTTLRPLVSLGLTPEGEP